MTKIKCPWDLCRFNINNICNKNEIELSTNEDESELSCKSFKYLYSLTQKSKEAVK